MSDVGYVGLTYISDICFYASVQLRVKLRVTLWLKKSKL